MKLCRFVLNDDPQLARSGVFHDGRVYETDGEKAIGIHDPGKVTLLTPLGVPPSVRVFEPYRAPNGAEGSSYRIQSISGLTGPNGELETPYAAHALDFDLHVVGVVADRAQAVDVVEAPQFVLGYALMIVLFDDDIAQEERTLGIPIGPSHDMGCAIGPYLTTPDELTEFTVGSDPTRFESSYTIKVNGDNVASGHFQPGMAFSELLAQVTAGRTVNAGEILAWPRTPKPPLVETALGRNLLEGDRIEAIVDGLGTLVLRIN